MKSNLLAYGLENFRFHKSRGEKIIGSKCDGIQLRMEVCQACVCIWDSPKKKSRNYLLITMKGKHPLPSLLSGSMTLCNFVRSRKQRIINWYLSFYAFCPLDHNDVQCARSAELQRECRRRERWRSMWLHGLARIFNDFRLRNAACIMGALKYILIGD